MRDIQVWHEARARGEDARRPSPLALGKDAFVGEMWRWVWDLRGDIPVPAAMSGRAHDGDFAVNAERLESFCSPTALTKSSSPSSEQAF